MTTNERNEMSDWRKEHETKMAAYRQQVRETFQKFSDQALAFQNARIIGGIDREECDRELARRRGF